MPPGFDIHDQRVQVWLPLTLNPANPGNRGGHFLYLVGRLKDGVSLAQARADFSRCCRSGRPRALADTCRISKSTVSGSTG